jgi:hypothetical protein
MDASIKETILGLCEAPKRGGRLVSDGGGGRLLLYDCGSWTDMHTEALRARYPEVELDVQACSQSLSGFVIMFRVRETPVMGQHLLLVLIGFVVALFIALLMHF